MKNIQIIWVFLAIFFFSCTTERRGVHVNGVVYDGLKNTRLQNVELTLGGRCTYLAICGTDYASDTTVMDGKFDFSTESTCLSAQFFAESLEGVYPLEAFAYLDGRGESLKSTGCNNKMFVPNNEEDNFIKLIRFPGAIVSYARVNDTLIDKKIEDSYILGTYFSTVKPSPWASLPITDTVAALYVVTKYESGEKEIDTLNYHYRDNNKFDIKKYY